MGYVGVGHKYENITIFGHQVVVRLSRKRCKIEV